MKIAIDLDGVVCDFVGTLKRIVTDKLDETKYDLGLSKVKFKNIWDYFTSRHGFVGIDFIEGAREYLKDLMYDHKVVFVTDRRRKDWGQTLDWKVLKGFDPIGIVFTEGNKAEHIINNQYDVFLDDKIDILLKTKDHVKSFLFDQPYNRDIEESVLYRVYNWMHVAEIIDMIYNGEELA